MRDGICGISIYYAVPERRPKAASVENVRLPPSSLQVQYCGSDKFEPWQHKDTWKKAIPRSYRSATQTAPKQLDSVPFPPRQWARDCSMPLLQLQQLL